MKIKIINDKNDFLTQMFQDTLKTYNYIKTDIILYLIYGEDVKWTYVQEEDVFYLKKFNTYLAELPEKNGRKCLQKTAYQSTKIELKFQ